MVANNGGLTGEFKAYAEESAKLHSFRQNNLEITPDNVTVENSSTLDKGSLQSQIREGLLRGIQVQMDNGTAQELGGALRGVDSVTASKVEEQKREQREKKNREARRLQALIDSLDAEIADLSIQIDALDKRIDHVDNIIDQLQNGSLDPEDAMDDPEVADAIAAWERRTGKTFDKDAENAGDVLAAILGTHKDTLQAERDGLDAKRDDRIRKRDEAKYQSEQLEAGQAEEAREIARQGSASSYEVAKNQDEENALSGAEGYREYQESKFVSEIPDADVDFDIVSIEELELDIEMETVAIESGLQGGLDGLEGVGVAHFTKSAQLPVTNDHAALEESLDMKIDLGPTKT